MYRHRFRTWNCLVACSHESDGAASSLPFQSTTSGFHAGWRQFCNHRLIDFAPPLSATI